LISLIEKVRHPEFIPKKKTKAGKFWGALTRCPHGDATGARSLGDELRHTEAAALQVSDVLWL